MSQDGDASTARHEPSLTDITNRKPFSISTIVWLTIPASKQRAAPWVRLASPEATAASWSALARSSRSDTAMSRPSAETTIACATPGTLLAKLETSQLRFCASLLSCVIVAPSGRRGVAACDGIFACCHHAAALEARAVAREHAPDFLRGSRGGGGRALGTGGVGRPHGRRGRRGRRGDHPRGQVRPRDPPRKAGLGRLHRGGLERRCRRWHVDRGGWRLTGRPLGAGPPRRRRRRGRWRRRWHGGPWRPGREWAGGRGLGYRGGCRLHPRRVAGWCAGVVRLGPDRLG